MLALVRRHGRKADPSARLRAVEALREQPCSCPALLEAAAEPPLRRALILALTATGDAGAAARIAPLAGDDSPAVGAAVADALGGLRATGELSVLERLATDGDGRAVSCLARRSEQLSRLIQRVIDELGAGRRPLRARGCS